MSYDLGTARGVIELDYNGKGAEQAKEDLEGIEKQGQKGSQALGKMGKTATAAGLVIAAGLGVAVNAAANFEQRLSAIQAVSGATASEMDDISKKALQLGKDTAFSATESAMAMEELIKAGLSVEDVLNGAADATVSLAAAGEVALPDAAMIASNAMNQFGLKAQDMVGVVDNIAGAANASAIDVGDFGQSLSQVGAVANLAGVSFEDTATAIALLGNAGIKGSDAGTSLKSMFQRLQPTTKKQKDLFKELGIITEDGANKFYDAQGNMKGLAQVSGILSKSLKGMTAEQKQATLNTLFGSDAIRAAAVLSNEGAKGFNKMNKEMGKVSAADVAKTRMDNLKGSIEELMGTLETIGIVFGQILLPYIKQLADALATAGEWFLSLDSGTQKTIVGILAAVAAILLIGTGIAKLVIFIKTFTTALAALRAMMAATWLAALGPIALIIAAIAALIAFFVILYKKNETFRNAVNKVWSAIKTAISATVDWLVGTAWPKIQEAWDGIVAGAKWLWKYMKMAWSGISKVVMIYIKIVATIIKTYVKVWTKIITTALDWIMNGWTWFWDTFGGIIKSTFGLIVAVLKLYWTIIKGGFLLWLKGIQMVVTTVWNLILGVFKFVWNAIKTVIATALAVIRTILVTGFNFYKAIVTRVWNAIYAIISAVWSRIGGRVMTAVNGVKNAIQTAWNAVMTGTRAMWNRFTTVVSDKVKQAWDKVKSIKDSIVSFFADAGSWLFDAGAKVIQGLIDGIESKIDDAKGAIGKVTGVLAKALPGSPVKEGPLRVLNKGYAGKQIVQMVIDGIERMAIPVTNVAENYMTPVAEAANPGPGFVKGRKKSGAKSGKGGLRFVRGRLSLDESGRAFISGVAQDTDDDNEDFNDVHDNMNNPRGPKGGTA